MTEVAGAMGGGGWGWAGGYGTTPASR
jgi:hypothetical protein